MLGSQGNALHVGSWLVLSSHVEAVELVRLGQAVMEGQVIRIMKQGQGAICNNHGKIQEYANTYCVVFNADARDEHQTQVILCDDCLFLLKTLVAVLEDNQFLEEVGAQP